MKSPREHTPGPKTLLLRRLPLRFVLGGGQRGALSMLRVLLLHKYSVLDHLSHSFVCQSIVHQLRLDIQLPLLDRDLPVQNSCLLRAHHPGLVAPA